MVHRPSDSRLLSNLLTHEKEYSKQFASLLERSQSSLASFSAFASASSPPSSQVIISVAGALAGADEALKNYAYAVEQWQQQLKALQELEEDVATIIRDREILVSRLIKVSKSQRSSREVTFGSSSSTSSLSFTVKPEVVVGSKLAAAQTELQACEAHLATKERELDVFRIAAIRSGLQLRCQAMVECGWAWGEMGKEGLRALELFDGPMPNGNAFYPTPRSSRSFHKPLPDPYSDQPSSDHSSLAPSQSASQVAGAYDLSRVQSPPLFRDDNGRPYTLHIPPAHRASEFTFPNGTARSPEQEEEGGGSSVGEDEGAQEMVVHENERFLRKRKGKAPAHLRAVSESIPRRQSHFPSSVSDSHLVYPPPDKKERHRKGSVFGTIAALFHSKPKHVDEDERSISSPGKWSTRTDKNLRKARRGGDSDDESNYSGFSAPPPPPIIPPPLPSGPPLSSRPSQRLKKKAKRGSVQVQASSSLATVDERAWATDGEQSPPRRSKPRQQAASESGVIDEVSPEATPVPSASASTATLKAPRKPKPKPHMLSAASPAEASLSRNSSISKHSIISAPPLPTQRTTIHPASSSPSKHASTSTSPPGRRRNASLDLPSKTPMRTGSLSISSGKVLSGAGYPPIGRAKEGTQPSSGSSSKRASAEPEMNLMSIVAGVRHAREAYEKQQDPNRLLVIAKAPPPVTQNVDLLNFEHGNKEDKDKEQKTMESSISTPSLPVVPNTTPEKTASSSRQPNGTWDKKSVPLRSALRNPSRSPSPSVSPHSSPPHSVAGPSKLRPPLPPLPMPPVQAPPPASHDDGEGASPESPLDGDLDLEDVASISSYETVHEVFFDSGSRTASPRPSEIPSPPPPPPPPHDAPESKRISTAIIKDTSHQAHARPVNGASPPPAAPRKSVRMSLPPTFSTTPPAIDDDEDPTQSIRRKRPPRAHPQPHTAVKPVGWSSRIHDAQPTRDVWDDSSDEDEEYGQAKRMLSKMTGKA